MCEHRICSICSHFQTFVFRKGANGLLNHSAVQTLSINTTQHNTTQHNTTQHNTTQHNTHKQIWWYCSLSFPWKLKLKCWIGVPWYVCIKKLILFGEFYDLTYPQRIIKAHVSGLTQLTMIRFFRLLETAETIILLLKWCPCHYIINVLRVLFCERSQTTTNWRYG
jgi:hypothetical protein